MKLIYLSHPYSGDEAANRTRAERISARLSVERPELLILNPLRCFEDYCFPYEQILEKCLALLARCDEIWMCYGWEGSAGCAKEMRFAKEIGLGIRFLGREYERVGEGEGVQS